MVGLGEGIVGCMGCQLAWHDPVETFVRAMWAEAEVEGGAEAEAEVEAEAE
jgi:hypothetical protein